MHPEPYWRLLAEPSAFWAANSNAENVPEIVRCSGVATKTNSTELTFFISEAFGRTFIQNLRRNSLITLAATCVPTFESYQYKGIYQSIRPCTNEEEEWQRKYVDSITDITTMFGYSKEGIYQSYLHQPSFAVTFWVQHIFEQTPHKGTGNQVINLEDRI
jgi:hypothetical protein